MRISHRKSIPHGPRFLQPKTIPSIPAESPLMGHDTLQYPLPSGLDPRQVNLIIRVSRDRWLRAVHGLEFGHSCLILTQTHTNSSSTIMPMHPPACSRALAPFPPSFFFALCRQLSAQPGRVGTCCRQGQVPSNRCQVLEEREIAGGEDARHQPVAETEYAEGMPQEPGCGREPSWHPYGSLEPT